jgi:LmbE family N-acetylglucosaminyl deacetylase
MAALRQRRLVFAALLLAGLAARTAMSALPPFLLGDEDRLLILAPHPDDETLAAGGLVQEALGLDLPVRVCFFTMGDNNEIAFLFTRKHPVLMPGSVRSTGPLRQREAVAAATQLGLATNDLVFLGYPDYGSLVIWNRHWRTVPPFRSMLTRATAVPYAKALTPGSAYAGEDILDDLEEVIRDFRPTLVVVSHPADHNVDHRALYLYARVALWELEAEGIAAAIFAVPGHFTHWPEPRTYQPQSPTAPPDFLDGQTDWIEFVLAPFQTTNKLAALRRHHSQYLHASAYLDSFIRKNELLGRIPDLSFPRGTGSIEFAESDTSQFRPDSELFHELARESDQWNAIAEQNASETATLGDNDNDFKTRALAGDGTHLTLSFQFRQPVSPALHLTAAVFGFRPGTPFGEMPKITIEATPQGIVSVKDLAATLPNESIELIPAGNDAVALRIPFALLGNPAKILTGARILKGEMPVDWVAWKAIDLAGASPTATPTPPPAAPANAVTPAPVKSAPPMAVAKPAPAQRPKRLTPRVELPRRAVPNLDEANEPVVW